MTKRPKVQSEVGAPTKMSVKKELILIPTERVTEVTLQDMLYSIQMRSRFFSYNAIPKCHSEIKSNMAILLKATESKNLLRPLRSHETNINKSFCDISKVVPFL